MKKYIFSAITILIAGSCKDVLLEKPKSLTVEEFYNTAQEVESGLAAIYSPIRASIGQYWNCILESQTEWGGGLTGAANADAARAMQGLDGVTANNVEGVWNNFFVAIRNANLVIANTPNSEVLTEEQKNTYVAEAKFMRALTYFNLVRAWGGVPLYTEENMSQTTGAPKGSKEEIYALIRADLEFAEVHLPENETLSGKPSKWAAKTLLADVYLYLEMFPESRDKANEVIAAAKYTLEGVSVADDFYKIFGLDANSNEEIFYFKYNVNSPSSLVLFTMEIFTPYFGSDGYGFFFWHKDARLYKEWNDADLRKAYNWYESAESNKYISGQSAYPQSVKHICPKKYSDPAGEALISTFDFPVYRYAELLLIYAEAAARANGGVTTHIMEKLNMVHRRAYGFNPLQPSSVDFSAADYDTEEFIDLILQERAYEFQYEAKRWFDLVRTGKVKEVMKRNIDRDVADRALLWPIPSIEFDLNEALDPATDQNPGF